MLTLNSFQTSFKFVSHSFQICFKFASNSFRNSFQISRIVVCRQNSCFQNFCKIQLQTSKQSLHLARLQVCSLQLHLKRIRWWCFPLNFVNFLIHFKFQKQPFTGALKFRFSWKFRKTQRKKPVKEFRFSKFTGLQTAALFEKTFRHRCFTVNLAKF